MFAHGFSWSGWWQWWWAVLLKPICKCCESHQLFMEIRSWACSVLVVKTQPAASGLLSLLICIAPACSDSCNPHDYWPSLQIMAWASLPCPLLKSSCLFCFWEALRPKKVDMYDALVQCDCKSCPDWSCWWWWWTLPGHDEQASDAHHDHHQLVLLNKVLALLLYSQECCTNGSGIIYIPAGPRPNVAALASMLASIISNPSISFLLCSVLVWSQLNWHVVGYLWKCKMWGFCFIFSSANS